MDANMDPEAEAALGFVMVAVFGSLFLLAIAGMDWFVRRRDVSWLADEEDS